MINKLDELLDRLGTGWWNVLHYVSMGYCMALPVCHALGGAFVAPKVDYVCAHLGNQSSMDKRSEHSEFSKLFANSTEEIRCTFEVMNNETGSFEEHPCNEWIFDNSTFTATLTSDFNLTCDRDYIRATYQSIYMIGVFVGGLIVSFMADSYGRKPIIFFGTIAFTILGLGSCWMTNLSALLFSRFLMGVIMPSMSNTCYIVSVEVSEARLRPQLGILMALPWAFGVMVWGGVAYFIRDWRWLQFSITATGLLIIPVLWFTDESPRWLAVNGYHTRALKILKKAAAWNHSVLPPDDEILDILKESRDVTKMATKGVKNRELRVLASDVMKSTTILFRTPRLRKITCTLYFNFLILNLVYYGLSLNGGNLSDNPFLFMVLSGVMEIPAYSLPVPLVSKFGRKLSGIGTYFLSGVVLLAIAPVPSGYSWLIMIFALTGKVAISAAFQIIVFYSSELFPTEVRSRGIGTSFMVARVGSIASPFITEILGSIVPWAPSVVFGVASVLASIATLTLPETLGTALPDTIAHLEDRATNVRSWKFYRHQRNSEIK